jgi:hypothetical protein
VNGFLALHERIRCIDDEGAQERLIAELLNPTRPYIVSFVNAHAANLAWRAPAMLESLLQSDLLLRDGIGVKLGMKALGQAPGVNMVGTDFIPRIVHAYQGGRAAIFGTRSPWLDAARRRLETEGLAVVACHDGFAPPNTYLDLAAEAKPELIILGMGMPRQEELAVQLRDRLSPPVLIVNGGAILDYLGGKVARAPEFMRHFGMEWVFRLSLEPGRLARRYVLGIPAFFSHLAVSRVMRRRIRRRANLPINP